MFTEIENADWPEMPYLRSKNTFMLRFLLVICAFAGLNHSFAQKDTLSFPASWEGNWKGTLDIYGGSGQTQSTAMELEIHKIDTSETRYAFGLVYGSKSNDYRPYELYPVAPKSGIWRIDEKNSIVMESYLYGPKFLCWFVVSRSRVFCTYEKVDENTIIFELYSGIEAAISTTGNSMAGSEKIPEVRTFPFSVFQRAILKRD